MPRSWGRKEKVKNESPTVISLSCRIHPLPLLSLSPRAIEKGLVTAVALLIYTIIFCRVVGRQDDAFLSFLLSTDAALYMAVVISSSFAQMHFCQNSLIG